MIKILLCILVCLSSLYSDDSYYWKEDYQKALTAAKESNKSLVLAFLGTNWCPWSEKLQTDVLLKDSFLKDLKDQAIFIRLDFPEGEQKEENKRLKEQFTVVEFPTLVLLDNEQNEIIKLGYMPMQSEEFGTYIKNLLTDWYEIKSADLAKMDEKQLENLYVKAKGRGFNKFKEDILQYGLTTSPGPFFLMEKYAIFIDNGKKMKHPEMQELRKEIVKRDPKNKNGTHLYLAVLDFQVLSNKSKKTYAPQDVVRPLTEYVKKFGKKDADNLWRVEMMIAQYLFSKRVVQTAVDHAKASFESAPENVKPEILETLNYLKNQQ